MPCGKNFVKKGLISLNILYALCIIANVIHYIILDAQLPHFRDISIEGTLVFSFILLNLSLLGLYGAFKKNYYCIVTYAIVVLISIIVTFAAISKISNEYQEFIENNIAAEAWSNYQIDPEQMHELQKEYRCCGSYHHGSYQNEGYDIPASCCSDFYSICTWENAYEEGCLRALASFPKKKINILYYTNIGIEIVALITLMFACELAKKIYNEKIIANETLKPTTKVVT